MSIPFKNIQILYLPVNKINLFIILFFFLTDFPCGYLPCLEMDGGFRMPETMSICRYIARQYGKCRKNSKTIILLYYFTDCPEESIRKASRGMETAKLSCLMYIHRLLWLHIRG